MGSSAHPSCSLLKKSRKLMFCYLLFSLMLLQAGSHLSTATMFGMSEMDDRLTLLAIKSDVIHDPQGVLMAWNDSTHFCSWGGITCGRRHQRVIVLNLASRGLVGALSPSVGNLSFVKEILLQNNTFKGRIPPQVGRLHRLQRLRLFNNSFEGEIPSNLSNCSRLVDLDVGNNRLIGKIPNEFRSLSKLESFIVHQNNFTGPIPPFLGNFTSLQLLSAAFNRFHGRLPRSLGRLKNLSFLGLGGNDLSGTIPISIFNLSSLTVMSMPENQLSGSLPPDLGYRLPRIRNLQLRDNQLSGLLPISISNCSKLENLGMERNNLHGRIEIKFGEIGNLWLLTLHENSFGSESGRDLNFIDSMVNCSDLHVLDLHINKLSGPLPNSVANLSTQLFYLNLGGNDIYGSLPLTIGNLVGLTGFGMEFTQLTGTIPSSIGNLRSLQRLALHGNDFSGEIPDSIGNLTLLNELYMAYNRLEGSIPASLGNCQRLLLLSLLGNNLNGSIPKEVFKIRALSISLNLGRNHFSGSLPIEVGSLENLLKLDVSENGLSGEIPSSIGSCTSLEILYLGGNFFRGSIPQSLSSLRGVYDLDLSRNNLSGQIPGFLQQISLTKLNLSFNDFEGEVPTTGAFANASAVSVTGNSRLCGGIPELHMPRCTLKRPKSKHRKMYLILIIVISLLGMLLGLAILSYFLFCCYKRKAKLQPSRLTTEMKASFPQISYERLLKATDGFSAANLIGRGSFGSVYKGVLDDDGMIVAVKVLDLQRRGALRGFTAECETLRSIRHRNLLKIITSCSAVDFQGNDFKALVYEFMPNGNLEAWLHPGLENQNGPDKLHRLNLLQRIDIVIDVASALDYLHNDCQMPIIHCDLKPSNILLDHNMTAKVGDFGLAKIISEFESTRHSSSIGVRGTIGYVAPEYGLGSEVSVEGDVYSYGILLLEMMTGKRPTDPMFQGGHNLHSFCMKAFPDHVMELVEPTLLANHDDEASTIGSKDQAKVRKRNEECLVSVIKIGVACSMESPLDRMDIRNVIHELHSVRASLPQIGA